MMYEHLEKICKYQTFWYWFDCWDDNSILIDVMAHGWLK